MKEEENLNSINTTDTQPLFEQPIILEGKRSRKPTLRLEMSESTPTKKEFSIPQVNSFFLHPSTHGNDFPLFRATVHH